MQSVYNQVAGFVLLMVLLMFANKTRLGHTIIYYSLLLLILSILLAEAPMYAALLGNLKFSGGSQPTAGQGTTTAG